MAHENPEIIRNDDGTLVVPVEPTRAEREDGEEREGADPAGEAGDAGDDRPGEPGAATITLHPGEGGYDEALAEWDLQQHPDRGPAVSTASGREQAMAVVHRIATDPDGDTAEVIADASPEPVAEALRHVLVGGQPSVEGFAAEIADAEGGDPLPPHQVTKVISEVLGEVDG
jgi:hypothetical protein